MCDPLVLEPSPPAHLEDGALEHWATPRWCTERLLGVHPPPTSTVVEPSAGKGAIVRVLAEHDYRVHAFEINPHRRQTLKDAGAESVDIDDWLSYKTGGLVSIVGNPPYRPAETMLAHVKHCLSVRAQYVALLLPLSFLSGGSGRRAFWVEQGGPHSLYFFSERPKFAGAGGQFECAWFVWDRNVLGRKIGMLYR